MPVVLKIVIQSVYQPKQSMLRRGNHSCADTGRAQRQHIFVLSTVPLQTLKKTGDCR